MQGHYPKGFEFTGWHPSCICYAEYETLEIDDFAKYIETGEINKSQFTTGIPDKAQKYLDKNGEKLLAYKNPPYWMDNFDNKFKLVQNEFTPAAIQIPPVENLTEKNISNIINTYDFEEGGLGRGWNEYYGVSNNMVSDVLEGNIVPLELLPKNAKKIPSGVRHHFMTTNGQYRWLNMYKVPEGIEI